MRDVTLSNQQLIPIINNLVALLAWLKPGTLSFRLGQLKKEVLSPAGLLEEEQVKLQREFFMHDETGIVIKQGKPVPLDGKSEAEFTERLDDLMNQEVTLRLPEVTQAFLEQSFEKDRLNEPKPLYRDGMLIDTEPTVDFVALLPLFIPTEAPAPEPLHATP